MSDAIQVEISKGRLWRAKEILRGRMTDAHYDPVLFDRLAGVLVAMHDDDEAGRFYLLAGTTDGEGGSLARAFLARRAAKGFTQMWSEMPAAARRIADMPPAGTVQLLNEAGVETSRIKRHIAELRRRSKSNRERRKPTSSVAEEARGQRIGLVVAAILLLILTVGIVGTMRLIWWGIEWATGLV